jgi:hypothetical protein
MKEIQIKYKSFFINHTLTRQMPERWAELSEHQLLAVAMLSKGAIPEYEYISEFADVPMKVIKAMGPYQIWNLGKLLTFTAAYDPWYKFIMNLPGLEPPKPNLEGMTFGQFMFVDTFYSDWAKDGEAAQLNNFVGALYLPKGEAFNTNKMGEYSDTAQQHVNEWAKIAITLNYRLVKEWLCNLYPTIFPRTDGESPAKKTETPNTNGWLQVFEGIVGDDIVNQEKYFELGVHDILRHLARKIRENAKR